MTLMGIQVCGTIENKFASTDDHKWGRRWKDIPQELQIYGIGDMKFGHMCYTILSAIVMIDLFPYLDIACKYLDCNQGCAVQLIWI